MKDRERGRGEEESIYASGMAHTRNVLFQVNGGLVDFRRSIFILASNSAAGLINQMVCMAFENALASAQRCPSLCYLLSFSL